MGQRSQIVFLLPTKYYGADNPNNEGEKILVYHNQWLYGIRFLKYAKKLLEALDYLIKEEKRKAKQWGWGVIEYDDIVEMAIKYANYSDLKDMTNSFEVGKDENLAKELSEVGVIKFLESFDNNNGYIIIDLTGEKIRFGLLNGYEDDDKILSRTAEGYLKLFYDEKEIEGKFERELKEVSRFFQRFESTDGLNLLTEFQSRIINKKLNGGDKHERR